jgi:hypothetical protein
VDASAIKPDLLGHSYFGDSATVLHDLFWLMKPGFDPEARLLRPAPWERSDIGSFSTSGHPSLEFLQCGGQAVSPAIARLSTGPGAGLKPVPCRHPSISRPTLIASDNATQRFVRPAGPLARGGFPRTPFGTTLRVGRPTGVTPDEAGDWLSLGTWEILDQLNLSSNEVQRGRSPSHVVSDAHFRIDLGQSGCQKTGYERPMGNRGRITPDRLSPALLFSSKTNGEMRRVWQ